MTPIDALVIHGQPERYFPEGGDVECYNFPFKLHNMLEVVEKEGPANIVSWNEDGRSFTIHNPREFAKTLMPKYFSRQTKYKSFQRQLNLYNFVRSSRGKDRRICKFF